VPGSVAELASVTLRGHGVARLLLKVRAVLDPVGAAAAQSADITGLGRA